MNFNFKTNRHKRLEFGMQFKYEIIRIQTKLNFEPLRIPMQNWDFYQTWNLANFSLFQTSKYWIFFKMIIFVLFRIILFLRHSLPVKFSSTKIMPSRVGMISYHLVFIAFKIERWENLRGQRDKNFPKNEIIIITLILQGKNNLCVFISDPPIFRKIGMSKSCYQLIIFN